MKNKSRFRVNTLSHDPQTDRPMTPKPPPSPGLGLGAEFQAVKL